MKLLKQWKGSPLSFLSAGVDAVFGIGHVTLTTFCVLRETGYRQKVIFSGSGDGILFPVDFSLINMS